MAVVNCSPGISLAIMLPSNFAMSPDGMRRMKPFSSWIC